MAAGMLLICIGRHWGSEGCFRTMVLWMTNQYLGWFCNFPKAERHISANACQCTWGVSQPWQRQSIKWGAPAQNWNKWNRHASSTSSSKGSAISSSPRPISSSEVVAHKVLCGSFRYILHVCGNGQRCAHTNAAQIPRFAKSLCVRNYTQSGQNRPKSHISKPCGNNSEGLGIEWGAPGICTSCPTGAQLSSTHMAIEHWTQWLWQQSEWSPPALGSSTNESPA